MMLAARVSKYGEPPSIVEVPVPHPAPHQVLVKCATGGFCHTDLQSIDGVNQTPLPFTIGHEPAGIIAALGSDAATSFQLRQRVGFMNPIGTCGSCHECSNGRFVQCDSDSYKLGGVTEQGCFSQYALADARFTFALPDSISYELGAPVMCAGVTTFQALKKADVPPNGSIAVIGCGGLGHLLIQFALALGYKVVAGQLLLRIPPIQN